MIEERLERALVALRALDPVEAAKHLVGPPRGPATARAKELWEQCMAELPKVTADMQRRVAALMAARTYQEGE